ncbi:MAG: PIN domain-containing protein [Deltaproteobacteria bacterium]|nr:PIN domain-containing protein [Deltaproteobacteria bacterium]
MIVYLDTSVVLRALLRDGPVLRAWGKWRRAYTSTLLGVEARRVIDRLRLTGALDDRGVVACVEGIERLEAAIGRIGITRTVLERASQPMGTVVGTLDALHVASALLLQDRLKEPVTFATHDARQAMGARALGLGVADAVR